MASACAVLADGGGTAVRGFFTFTQDAYDAPTNIAGEVVGLFPEEKYKVAVYTFGNIQVTARGEPNKLGHCFNAPHGELGSLVLDERGKFTFSQDSASAGVKLIGPQSIIGRSLAVTNNSGEIVAFGVIGIDM